MGLKQIWFPLDLSTLVKANLPELDFKLYPNFAVEPNWLVFRSATKRWETG